MMYNRILVAVDGSETSNLALKEAIKLAKDQHAALRFVHVVDVSLIYIDLGAPYVLEYQKALQATGQKVIDDCSAIVRDAGIEFDTTSIVVDMIGQHVYDAIEEEAKRWQADLIVIGTHGRRGIRRFLLGSIAEGVARVTSKPVLLIRGG
jgi:nucleotide-binding universal stress UspA family protein